MILILGWLLAAPSMSHAQSPSGWVDDLTQEIEFMVDGLWYDLLRLHAEIQCCTRY